MCTATPHIDNVFILPYSHGLIGVQLKYPLSQDPGHDPSKVSFSLALASRWHLFSPHAVHEIGLLPVGQGHFGDKDLGVGGVFVHFRCLILVEKPIFNLWWSSLDLDSLLRCQRATA